MERVNTRQMHRIEKFASIFFFLPRSGFYRGEGKFNSRVNLVSEECAREDLSVYIKIRICKMRDALLIYNLWK